MTTTYEYNIDDFFNPGDTETTLMQEAKYWEERNALPPKANHILANIRGIILTDKGEYKLSETDFVKYIFSTFSVIRIADSIAFYNYAKRKYKPLSKSVYLHFFKQLLDEIDISLWSTKLEARYASRFIRDISTHLSEWSVPKHILVFDNGIYNVATRKFKQGIFPDIYNFESSPVSYDPTATCPQFMKFMNDITNKDKDLQTLIQQICGYTFEYGSTPTQKLFLLYGSGRNGKGKLCNILTAIHGENNVSTVSISNLSKQFGLASVYDKVMNISSENQNSVTINTEILKSCSGGDRVSVEKKYCDVFPSKIYAKMWLSSNEFHVDDQSRGFSERLITIPFPISFVENPKDESEREIDVHIEERLIKELPGIVNYFLSGLHQLQDNGYIFHHCEAAEKLKDELLSEKNPVKIFFEECIGTSFNGKIKASDLPKQFNIWARQNKIPHAITSSTKFHSAFQKILKSEGLLHQPVKTNGGINYYKGIQLLY